MCVCVCVEIYAEWVSESATTRSYTDFMVFYGLKQKHLVCSLLRPQMTLRFSSPFPFFLQLRFLFLSIEFKSSILSNGQNILLPPFIFHLTLLVAKLSFLKNLRQKKKKKKSSKFFILQFWQCGFKIDLRVPSVLGVSRWGGWGRRTAASRRSLNASCEEEGRSLSTAGERRSGPPCDRPDSAG